MAYIAVTNTFVTGTTFSSTKMNTNFDDIIDGLSDGTKDLNLINLETKGTVTINGNTVFGTTSADKIYIYTRLKSNIILDGFNLGNATYPFKELFLNESSVTNGGTIYFNGGTSSYIQSDTTSNILTIAGFSGITITEDGYLRFGTASDLEFALSTDNIIIRNRTQDKGINFYVNDGGVDTLVARTHDSTPALFETFQRKENMNVIINGDMRIDQRDSYTASGTRACAAANFVADRFYYVILGTNSYTKYIDSAFANNNASNGFPRHAGVYVTSQNATPGATDYEIICQKIEGYLIDPYMHLTCTLSFWVKSSLIGSYAVAFQNYGTTGLPSTANNSYVAEYTINVADTWEYKTISINLNGAAATGTWNFTNGMGLNIIWTLCAGSNFVVAANTWSAGAYLKTASTVNNAATNGNTFFLTGVQFTPTPFAIPFQTRFIDEEINLCQRYAEKTKNLTVGMYTTSTAGSICEISTATDPHYQYGISSYKFKTRKRDVPTATIYNIVSSAAGYASVYGGTDTVPVVVYAISETNVYAYSISNSFAVNNAYDMQYFINSEF